MTDAPATSPATTASGAPLARGAWCLLGEPLAAAHVAAAGFDWVCLDAQHGAFDDARVLAAVPAIAALAPATPVAVRVGAVDAAAIGRALDAGASIVIVPLVESAADARTAVEAAFYPPRGRRSWGPLSPLRGAPVQDPATANATTRVWAMVETPQALEELDAILATPGLDGIFLGPYDLALALGLGLDELLGSSPVLPRVAAAARAAGLAAGAFAGTPERARRLRELGFDAIAIATDTGIVASGAAASLGAAAPSSPPY